LQGNDILMALCAYAIASSSGVIELYDESQLNAGNGYHRRFWKFQGAFGLVIVISSYISVKTKDDCLLHGLRMVQPLRFYP
jgi:hypothetical protein